MLGLLGLMGAVMAGFMVDALMARDPDEAEAGEDDAPPEDGSGAAAGMPHSDDLDDPPDQDLVLKGGGRADILTGEGGDDRIEGHEGNDLLGGRAGDDSMTGGAGFDWLRGGEGRDDLDGAGGEDDLKGEAGADALEGGQGSDRLSGDGGADDLAGGLGDDAMIGGQGADRMDGGAGDDALQGGKGGDLMQGGVGVDTLDGNEGADTLDGGPDLRADFLNGGTGDDLLKLGAGDWGHGDLGADIFALPDIAPGDPLAQISDYDGAEDRLVLVYDPTLHAEPEVTILMEAGSDDATVCLDGVPVARVLGGAGLAAEDVELMAA